MKNNKRILVTGGAGFIGSHIARRLISEGYKVIVADNLFTGKLANVPKEAEFIKMDLGKEASFKLLKNVDCRAVLHLAGQSSGELSFKDPVYDMRSHLMSTFLLLDWCKARRVSRFIYASSMSVYGDPKHLPIDETHPTDPKTFYGAGKLSAEAYIRLYNTLGIDTTIFRLFSVYGPGQNLSNMKQGMISIYLAYMLNGLPIEVKGSGERFRDFIYIDDVVDIWLSSLNDRAAFGKFYNIGSGKRTKVKDLIAALKSAFGSPGWPVKSAKGTPGDQFGVTADITKISRELKWRPKVDLREGLGRMVSFEKERS